jgi:membrane protease YdiL (CAAX protease family)
MMSIMKSKGIFKHFLLAILFFLVTFSVSLLVVSFVVLMITMKHYLSVAGMNNQATVLDFANIISQFKNSGSYMLCEMIAFGVTALLFLTYWTKGLKQNILTLGLFQKSLWKSLGVGAGFGLLIAGLIFIFNLAIGSIFASTNFSTFNILVAIAFLCFYFVQSLAYELVFRGYLINFLREKKGGVFAVFVSSIAFAITACLLNQFSLLTFISTFLFGTFLGGVYLQNRDIWLTTSIHLFFSFAMIELFGSNGNFSALSYPLFMTTKNDSALLFNGSANGLSSGLIAILVLLAFNYWNVQFKKSGRILAQ